MSPSYLHKVTPPPLSLPLLQALSSFPVLLVLFYRPVLTWRVAGLQVRALLGLLFSAPSLRAARALPTRDGAPELVASRHNTADSKPNSNINVDATTNMDTNTTANTNTSIDIDAKAQGIGNSLLYVVGFAFSRDLRKLAALAPDLAPLLLPQGGCPRLGNETLSAVQRPTRNRVSVVRVLSELQF